MEARPSYQQQHRALHHPQYNCHHAAAICLGLGLGLVLSAPSYPEVYQRYDDVCAPNSAASDNSFATAPCRFTFTISEALPAPVYLYYGFKGFFQNHRRYLKFVSYPQLSSGNPWATDA